MAEFTIPGGKEKGSPIAAASQGTLEWWSETIAKNLKEGSSRNADWDTKLVAAMRAELDRRAKGGKPAESPKTEPKSTALANTGGAQIMQRPSQSIVGSYADAAKADAALRAMSEAYHLVAPATSCGSLPLGHEVSISLVYVNAETETSSVGGGKVSLAATALKRIAAAASIDWDDEKSRRLDNGRDPHYVHFKAVGIVKNLDGTKRRVTGEVEIDMREGSPQVIAMEQRAGEGKNFQSQLRDTRNFILRHAETKAKSRAIADMGVRRSYTKAELEKPFAVARLSFTGRTEDPQLQAVFASKIADAALGAGQSLYGTPVGMRPQQSPPELPGHAPPAIGAVPDDDDAYETEGQSADATPLPTRSEQQQGEPKDGTSQQTTLPGTTSASSPY